MNTKQIDEYKKLAQFLSETLGDSFEVALHDVNDGISNIIAIYNPISKRSEYSDEADFVKEIISTKEYEKKNSKNNFKIQTKEGKTLHSATFFIKEGKNLVGMLCVNHDKSEYENMAKILIKLGGLNAAIEPTKTKIQLPKKSSKNITDNLNDEIIKITSNVVGLDIANSNLMPSVDQKKEIVSALYKNGIFSVKGAISEVAKLLKISEPSVYRYMSEAKNEDRQNGLMYHI